MTVWYGSKNESGFRAGQRLSIDEPCVTVMAQGMGGDSLGHWHFYNDGKPEMKIPRPSNKSQYRVPSMQEIEAIEPNGLSIVSTFSGCGGSCLGFRMAGYNVLYANEFIPAAQDTYRANHPSTYLDTRDIRTVTADDILQIIGKQPGELDVLEGSPPCASFSTAGKREKGWGKEKKYSDTVQRADDLFFEYIRLLEGLQPRTFIAENVSGLIKGSAKGYFKEILAAMKAAGYRVEAKLLDAQWLGVPQARQRIIFQGVRNDLDKAPAFPKPLPYRYSVRDALPWIARVATSQDDFVDASTVASPTVLASTGYRTSSGFKTEHGSRVETIVGIENANGYNGHADMSPDEPMQTVQAQRPVRVSVAQAGGNLSMSSVTHPIERRKFTIAELRRICAFPDDFILTGTYAQQWERLGRSVPPVMMSHIAAAVRDGVLT